MSSIIPSIGETSRLGEDSEAEELPCLLHHINYAKSFRKGAVLQGFHANGMQLCDDFEMGV